MPIVALLGVAAPVAAIASTIDPTGDFLPTFTGPHNADLDVTSVDARLQGSNFRLTGTMAGAIGTTPSALYVWGIDRGAGTEGLFTGPTPIGAGVKFDSVLVLRPDGTGTFIDIVGGGTATPLDPHLITIDGNTLTALLPIALAPSRGFSPGAYTFDLWPRIGLASNAQIADLAPDHTDIPVPEPASLLLLGSGLVALFGLRRRSGEATPL